MGVPKFFRYISERYPCLSELVRENQIPEFDNLYLDMNGIIHTCSHPNDNDPHFRISEEDIFNNIAHYIEILFRMIQPQKLFFMAVDGVAPRAKMNQQRGRRFRSAREAQDLEDAARAKGEQLPTEARFDSNCITPGTAFMARLQEFLKSFVQRKMNTNSNWQKCRVILSGHETPGEGEHKIMEYIRYLKASPDYDPNTRHCLYGLDADLIMLGLCSHEPHFSLLREEVKFGRHANSKNPSAEETRFYLLHLSILRDYLEQEFISLKKDLTFKYDMEKIIDDWIFMGFLVGNDFIPHLPNMHISSNALPLLYGVYKDVLPKLDGYINECGVLNLKRLEIFMERLSALDRLQFSDANADLQYFSSKLTDDTWMPECEKNTNSSEDLKALMSAIDELLLENDGDEKEWSDMTEEEEFNLHKRDYYINKLGYKEVTPAVLMEQAECYIRALQWTLAYYYRGVCSWGWFYPHHYAPFMSDVKNFAGLDYSFSLGKPFLPFEQLLAVLPAASGTLLPEAYRKLMVNADSPILHYYPTTFETDLNGKKQDWEAVVLIPFIEEELLLKSMEEQKHLLLPEEVARNVHGPMLQYDFVPASETMPDVTANTPQTVADCVKITEVLRSEVYVPPEKLVLGPVPGAEFNVYYPGFPTMKHLRYTFRLEKGQVRVFDQITRNDSMIIELEKNTSNTDTKILAQKYMGKSIYVQWPHLIEAKVVGIIDDKVKYSLRCGFQLVKETHDDVSRNKFNALKKSIKKHSFDRMGIDISETQVLFEVQQLKNHMYVFGKQGKVTLEKEWCTITSHHALQTCLLNLKVHNKVFKEYKNISDIFTKDQRVYLLSKPYYGSVGVLHNIEQTGRLKIAVLSNEEPDFTNIKQKYSDILNSYLNSFDAAARLGISNFLMGRITGMVFIMTGNKDITSQQEGGVKKLNIGLNMKYTKKNEELTGFSRRVGNTWFYSVETLNLMREYMQKFPEVFKLLNQGSYGDMIYESDLYPDDVGKGKLDAITNWLKAQPHNDALKKSSESEALTGDLVDEIIEIKKKPRRKSRVIIAIKPKHVYVPGLQPGASAPDPDTVFKLFDRVVNIRPNHTVPLGNTGTVIGVHVCRDPNPMHQNVMNEKNQDVFLDILFDESFSGASSYYGMKSDIKSCYRMTPQSLINITFGNETNTTTLLTPKESTINANKHKEAELHSSNPVINSPVKILQKADGAKNNTQIHDDKVKEYQNKINSCPEQRKQFWDDLMKQKSNPVAALPSSDTGTEVLKQLLGVNKIIQPLSNIPVQLPTWQNNANPISVADMFKHAATKASPLVAPKLPPPPPVQWYGPPPNQNNLHLHNPQQVHLNQPQIHHNQPQIYQNQQQILHNQQQILHNQQQVLHNQQPVILNQQPIMHVQKQVPHNQQPILHHNPPLPQQLRQPQVLLNKPQVHLNQPPVQLPIQLPIRHMPVTPPNLNIVNASRSPRFVPQTYPPMTRMASPTNLFPNMASCSNQFSPNNHQQMMMHKQQQQQQQQPLIKQQHYANNMNASFEKNENQEINKTRNGKVALQAKVESSPSAFIPLQAVKKARVPAGAPGTSKEHSTSPNAKEALVELKKLEEQQQKRQEVDRKQNDNPKSFQKYLINHNNIEQNNKIVNVQQLNTGEDIAANTDVTGNKKKTKPVKKSRIAANFGKPM